MSNTFAQIHTIYVGELSGEPQFGRRLVRALQEMGRFELTDDRALADAVLTAYGADEGEGFVGDLKLHDLSGAPLWSAHALRPHGSSGPMAYERLLEQLRAALAAQDDQSRTV
jgi:ribosomal protein L3